MSRGGLIVFEGCDRCGKTTQCKRLVSQLKEQKIEAEFMTFPDRSTRIGGIIDDYLCNNIELDDHAVHLLFSANRWELVPTILSKLKDGITLVVDRYAFSGVAFSGAKKNLTMDWCIQPDIGLPEPDLVLYLDLSPEAAAMRGGFGDERYEKSEFQVRVANNYKSLLAMNKNTTIIDADKDIDDLQMDIVKLVQSALKNIKSEEISTLWTKSTALPS